jgi:hypothetical protein
MSAYQDIQKSIRVEVPTALDPNVFRRLPVDNTVPKNFWFLGSSGMYVN